jgi:glycerol-3-phosphate dehydrogenase
MTGEWRAEALEELGEGTFDLLVIGAGIVGARVAYEAAAAGLRVALVDAGDFGGATSSASSKLVHGGLRYLATGDVRLVRQLQQERTALAQATAPHLVHDLPLVLAVPHGRRRDVPKLALALQLYASVTGWAKPAPRMLDVQDAADLAPALDDEAIAACGLVHEAQTDDGRLTLATVKAAVRAGAVAVNYAAVRELEHADGHLGGAVVEDVYGRQLVTVRCRSVVNAAGPWVDAVRGLEAPRAKPLTRFSKGVHVLLPLDGFLGAGVAVFDAKRSAFAVPWEGMLLLGVTDTPYDGDPGAVQATDEDVREVLGRFDGVLRDGVCAHERVRYAFAGVRVLAAHGNGDTARASRRHIVDVGPLGVVSIAGGKLTTHRRIAVDALRQLPTHVRPKIGAPCDDPLPGSGPVDVQRLPSDLDADVVRHLLRLYGSEVASFLDHAGTDTHALERIHPSGPDVWGQARYAVDHEWALTPEDVLRRRTTVAVRGLADARVTAAVRHTIRSARKPAPAAV